MAVPPVSMVDDILCIQKNSDSRNALIELKKLTLSNRKCRRIHIGTKSYACPDFKIHDDKMKDSTEEKYLGDLINTTGNIKAIVADRGHGIISEIRAIINKVRL